MFYALRRRPWGRLFYWLLAAGIGVAALALSELRVQAAAADPVAAPAPQSGPATTTVADTVFMADGTAAVGDVVIIWTPFITAGGTPVTGGSTTSTLGAGGALSVALVPNAGATPAGTYYTVVYQLGPGQVRTEFWVVPATSPANLAAVRVAPGAGLAGQAVSLQYVNTQLAGKANDSAVVHLSGAETISGGRPGEEKKDAAISFLRSAMNTAEAVAAREITDPEKFKSGISKIIDGTVECLNASSWAKQRPASDECPS